MSIDSCYHLVEFVFEYLPSLASPPKGDDLSVISTTGSPSPRQSPSVTLLSPEESIWLSEHRSDHSQIQRPSSGSISIGLSPLRQHWPLEDEHEARLLQYFVTDLASWVSSPDAKYSLISLLTFCECIKFDYCDPFNTFATAVAQFAATSAPLRNAIFATSARHLSSKSGQGIDLADQYHRKCLELLIPMLDNTDAVLDEGLYAATVILRLYEEISGKQA